MGTFSRLMVIYGTGSRGKSVYGRREIEKGRPPGFFFRFLAALLAFGLCLLIGPYDGRAEPQTELVPPRPSAEETVLTPLVIETATGGHHFEVELAITPDAQTRGLMFRESLASNQGMLFDYGTPRNVTMWMKNTFIPLDILFLDESGRILRVRANATPRSLESIHSGGPARAVLELPAGSPARIEVKRGNIVRHRIFGETHGLPDTPTKIHTHGG